MRLLYVGRASVGHDRRFIDAWRAAGVDVDVVEMPVGTEDPRLIAERIRAHRPDLVQAGPLTHPARETIDAWTGPLIATSWGFDLLHDIAQSQEARAAASAVLARADLVFLDNDATRREAISVGARPERIVSFPWGLDAQWLEQPLTSRRPAEDSVFLSTRRHEDIYRVEDILEAFLRIADRHARVRLRIAGSGSLTPRLHRIASASEFGDRVEFLGERSPAELLRIYADADVYVSASSVDGSSVSLLEAMASGLPALVSRIAGNQQWVTSDTGFDFPLGDVDSLAQRMSAFASDNTAFAAEVTRRATAAKSEVGKRANWTATVTRFNDFARLAIANHAMVSP